jgi:thiol-disulfide isomerase/thioredoxin
MRAWIAAFLVAALFQQPDAETRVLDHLKANVKSGQPLDVSQLNQTFKKPDEQKAVQRFLNSFFRIPVVIIEFQKRTGRIPTLRELSEQFDFKIPGEMDVVLRAMEADPRIPRFLTRNPATGEITRVDEARIKADPKFGPAIERSVASLEKQVAPNFAMVSIAKLPVNTAQLRGQPYLIYFWFSNCPPCVQTTPMLVRLFQKYSPQGFQIVAANGDNLLGLPYTDLVRADHIRKQGIRFPVGHVTPVMQQTFGVTFFPSMFFVNRQGVIVKHLVGPQSEDILDTAIRDSLK